MMYFCAELQLKLVFQKKTENEHCGYRLKSRKYRR